MKTNILNAAIRLSKTQGLFNLKRREIAQEAGCGNGTVNYHFKSMDALRGAVIAHAIEHQILEVLTQARAKRDPRIGRMSAALKERVANHIAGR